MMKTKATRERIAKAAALKKRMADDKRREQKREEKRKRNQEARWKEKQERTYGGSVERPSQEKRPLSWRLQQLRGLRQMVEENEVLICEAVAKDLRRPKTESQFTEVFDCIAHCALFEKDLHRLAKRKVLPTPFAQRPVRTEVWKEPYGVVTIIAPWNYPIGLMLVSVIGVIAAGNACIMKPSEVTGSCSALIEELIPRYLDSSAVRVVTGGVAETTVLLAQKVDFIAYTGGGSVGKIVAAAAAKHLTPVLLELGGKCPVYIDESANIPLAAKRIVWCKNFNAGQTCIAPDYVMVHEKVRDSFLEQLQESRQMLYPGKEQENPDISRIVNEKHFKRVESLLHGHGGKVLFGGATNKEERFVAFTVVTDPTLDSDLMKEEIFGPILPVVSVNSIEEAISRVNAGPTPLAAYIFGRSKNTLIRWASEVPSGGTCANDSIVQVANPRGGLNGKGESGVGVTRGLEMFESFSHRKVVAFQSPDSDVAMKYPPYKEIALLVRYILIGFPSWVKRTAWYVSASVVVAVCMFVATFVARHVSVKVTFH